MGCHSGRRGKVRQTHFLAKMHGCGTSGILFCPLCVCVMCACSQGKGGMDVNSTLKRRWLVTPMGRSVGVRRSCLAVRVGVFLGWQLVFERIMHGWGTVAHRFPFWSPTTTTATTNTPPHPSFPPFSLFFNLLAMKLGSSLLNTLGVWGLGSVLLEDFGNATHVAVGFALNLPFGFRSLVGKRQWKTEGFLGIFWGGCCGHTFLLPLSWVASPGFFFF